MEKNKYYTPSDDEFHIGFEYEALEDERLPDDNDSWSKCDIRDNYELERVGRNLWKNYSDLRVKYLDREDIESLGFEYDNNAEPIPSRQDWEMPKLENFELPLAFDMDTQLENGKCYILYLYKDDTVWIEYIKDCCGMGCLFKGIIKNISELKRLLKQLGIT